MKTLTIDGVTYEIYDEQARTRIGDLSKLNTTSKTDLVTAINEAAQTGGNSGGNADLTGYAKEQWVQQNYQPKGDYLESSALTGAVNTALEQAKASGEFDGKDYVLTPTDKTEIAEIAAELVDVPDVTVPTKVSELTNDSGYQTAAEVTAIVNQQLGVIENGTY